MAAQPTALHPGEALSPDEIRRYGRHLILPQVGKDGQERLKAARVLLVGAGGLGSPLALYLAAAGVGTLGMADGDTVDETNLQRQILYGTSDLGRLKTEAAIDRLRDVNPHVCTVPHGRIDAENILAVIADYDIVVDGSDNFPTRYLVNDACALTGKPDVWGAVLRFEGQAAVFWADHGPCYRCLFPEPPPAHLIPSCAEGGVLGVLPGIIGSLQASETLKLLLEIGDPIVGRFMTFDALRFRFKTLELKKSEDCPICSHRRGSESDIHDPQQFLTAHRMDYDPVCERTPLPRNPSKEIDVAVDSQDLPFEITVQRLSNWLETGEEVTILDVREPQEHEICQIKGSVLLPLRQLPQRLDELDRSDLIVVHCHHGARSAQAVAYMKQQGFPRVTNLQGGIDAWSVEVDPTVARY